MLKNALLAVLFLLPIYLKAQDVPCNCADNLAQTIYKTEANYAGFIAKVNSGTRPPYTALVDRLQKNAATQTDKKKCFYIIKEYVRFFKDKHFSITYSNDKDFDIEIIKLTDRDFKTSLKQTEPEGIWISADTSLTLGIKKMPGNEFKAVVLKAKDPKLTPGLVYFTLKPHKKGYLLKQYNVFNSTDMYAVQRGNLLQLWNFGLYARISNGPISPDDRTELLTWRNHNNGLDFKMLDDETAYIKIPTFFNNDNKVAKLVADADKQIRTSKYFIIDLRSNGGGSAGWSNLLPYVMTNTINQGNTLLRVSEDNIKLKRAEMEYLVKNPIPAELKPYYTDDFMVGFKQAYKELETTKNDFLPIPAIAIPMEQELQKPEKVALITDGLCGSSAEYFFYLMGQSKKTVRYGVNSVGMMDYEGPSQSTTLPCKELILMIPISKSSWTDTQPIDDTGFTPDVVINKPYSQWIDFVCKDIRQR